MGTDHIWGKGASNALSLMLRIELLWSKWNSDDKSYVSYKMSYYQLIIISNKDTKTSKAFRRNVTLLD